MNNTIHEYTSVVQYDKEEKHTWVRVWPHTVIISPSRNDGMYMLTAISNRGSYTIEASYMGKSTPHSYSLGVSSYREVRLQQGTKVEGRTTVHATTYKRNEAPNLDMTEADVTVYIQSGTKVFYAVDGVSANSQYLR